jgi:hypothetical protein
VFGLFFDPEDGGDMFLGKVGWLSTDYMVLHPRRQTCSNSLLTEQNLDYFQYISTPKQSIPTTLHAKKKKKKKNCWICTVIITVSFQCVLTIPEYFLLISSTYLALLQSVCLLLKSHFPPAKRIKKLKKLEQTLIVYWCQQNLIQALPLILH